MYRIIRLLVIGLFTMLMGTACTGGTVHIDGAIAQNAQIVITTCDFLSLPFTTKSIFVVIRRRFVGKHRVILPYDGKDALRFWSPW